MSQHAQPAEVPSELVAELEQQINMRWWNTVTGELSWEDPALHTAWRKVEPGETPARCCWMARAVSCRASTQCDT
jgi:hypothetical protein